MQPGTKSGFELDARLESNSVPVMWLGLCELRLVNDGRWIRLMLVPQRTGVEEIHELSPLDQAMLTFEICMVSKALKHVAQCDTVNMSIACNAIRQLRVDMIARSKGDAGWPDTVWDDEPCKPRDRKSQLALLDKLRAAM
ncbi:MAG: HIT domain-containing protein [Rhizobiaceae bacterium]|nr:HIT domain-containing protein [Rhizobiaceae bacterium]